MQSALGIWESKYHCGPSGASVGECESKMSLVTQTYSAGDQ